MILTKLDGDTRGGAALSIKPWSASHQVLRHGREALRHRALPPRPHGQPHSGHGRRDDAHRKGAGAFDGDEAEKLVKRGSRDQLTLEDFLSQMQQMKKMGGLQSMLSMLPGVGNKLANVEIDEDAHEEARGHHP